MGQWPAMTEPGVRRRYEVETENSTHFTFLTIVGLSGERPQRCPVTVTQHENDMPGLNAQITIIIMAVALRLCTV